MIEEKSNLEQYHPDEDTMRSLEWVPEIKRHKFRHKDVSQILQDNILGYEHLNPTSIIEIEKNLSELTGRLKKLEEYLREKNSTELSDEEAEQKIISYLKAIKLSGVSSIDILKVSLTLNLPADQVDRIFYKLEKEEVLK